MHLITYIANDGDLMDGSNTKSNSNNGNFEHKHDEELVHLQPMDISNLSKSQHEHVNDLIGEAMEETEEQKDEGDFFNLKFVLFLLVTITWTSFTSLANYNLPISTCLYYLESARYFINKYPVDIETYFLKVLSKIFINEIYCRRRFRFQLYIYL